MDTYQGGHSSPFWVPRLSEGAEISKDLYRDRLRGFRLFKDHVKESRLQRTIEGFHINTM